MQNNLTEKTIDLFCIQSYENSSCISVEEYKNDLKRIKYIKKFINRYKNKNILKERIILNHLICFFNVFNIRSGIRILFFFINEKDYDVLIPFLFFLEYINQNSIIENIRGKNIDIEKEIYDINIFNKLKEL